MPTMTRFRCPVKPTRLRPVPAGHRFGAGLTLDERIRWVEFVHVRADYSLAITENPAWHLEDDDVEAHRYVVRSYRQGAVVARQGCDTLGQAQALVRHLSTPLPRPQVPSDEDQWWWAENRPARREGRLPGETR